MFVVMIILPSILMVFDKVIINTTLGFRKGRKNMKKKLIIISLISILSLSVFPVQALTKDETVYAKLDSTGKVKKVTVTNHLINDEKKDTIIDYSNLTNIENTSGNERFKVKDSKITWEANKKDIYYKGNTKSELPVSLNINYKLDNKNMKISNMLGKKGHVDIELKYTNNIKEDNLYVPFTVITSTILDGSKVSNIKVNNGKIVSNGNNYIVAGIALPGLYESLNFDSLKDMDTITISFDTTNFNLPSIYSVVTPKVVDSIDLDKLNGLDNIYYNMDVLSNSSKQLVDGSRKINEGANTIYNGVSLSLEKLKNNQDTIDDNTLSVIQNKVSNETVATIENRKEEIMKQAIEKVIEKEEETHQIKNASDCGIDNNEGLLNALKLAAHQEMQTTEQGKQAYDACQAGVSDYCIYVTQAEEQAINKMKEAMYNSAIELAKQTAANTAYQTALSVAKETADSVSGVVAKEVFKQTKETVLNRVVLSLEELKQGLETLKNGTNELQLGLETFNNQGINKLTNIVNQDIKPNIDKVKRLKRLAHNYNTFTGTKNIDTTTKFIISIDSVSKNEKQSIKKENTKKESFIDRVKNLFK